MDPIRIAIIDDSPLCIKTVSRIIEDNCNYATVAAKFTDPIAALPEIKKLQPDLLLLDIEMPGLTGFEFLNKCRSFKGGVIFITAHNNYAVQAFKFSALDYLLKPANEKDLLKAIAKFRRSKMAIPQKNSIKELASNMAFMSQPRLSKIALSTAQGIEIARIDDILYLKADSNYTTVKREAKKDILVAKTLKDFEATLLSPQFIRAHNSYLINMEKIERYIRADGGFAIMQDGTEVPVSRRHRDNFLKQLKSH